MGTFSSPILPNSSGLDLGSPSQRWDAFLKDVDASGSVTITGTFSTSSMDNVQFADQFAGGDVGAKINAAIAALPGTGGIVDARGFQGTQTISSAISVGNAAGTKPVCLLLGAATFTTSATITVYRTSAIQGLPAASGTGTGGVAPASVIQQAGGSNLAAVVQCGDGANDGNNAVLRDFMVDGNLSGNAGALDGILINKSSRCDIMNMSIRNAKRDGLRILSTVSAGVGNNESVGTKILKLISLQNGAHGITVFASSDTFISESEFENNPGYGLNGLSCGGLRAVNNDFGGNLTGGVFIGPNLGQQGGATGLYIVANQFGFNTGHALTIQGWDATLAAYGVWGVNVNSNNIFSNNAAMSTNTFDAINITDSRWNSVTGNVIQNLAAGHVFRYGINLVETAAGRLNQNTVVSNPMDALFGTGTFTDNGSNFNTAYYGNADLTGVAAWRLSTPYLRNNDTIKWKDSGGVLYSVLQASPSDQVFLYGHATGKDIKLQPNPGITRFELTDAVASFPGIPVAIGTTVNSYNGIATVGNGVPAEYAQVNSTGLVAAVTTTTLYTPAATGWFRVSAILKITTVGTSPVVGPITITYTDGDGSVAQSQVMLLKSVTGTVVTTTVNNSTTTGTVNGTMDIYALTGVPIQYAIAVSGTFGAGVYSAHLKLEAL